MTNIGPRQGVTTRDLIFFMRRICRVEGAQPYPTSLSHVLGPSKSEAQLEVSGDLLDADAGVVHLEDFHPQA